MRRPPPPGCSPVILLAGAPFPIIPPLLLLRPAANAFVPAERTPDRRTPIPAPVGSSPDRFADPQAYRPAVRAPFPRRSRALLTPRSARGCNAAVPAPGLSLG